MLGSVHVKHFDESQNTFNEASGLGLYRGGSALPWCIRLTGSLTADLSSETDVNPAFLD